MPTGTVKFFNEAKGFGFITPDNGQAELFVHITGIIGTIREGDKVNFEIEQGKKGPNAVRVQKAD